MPQPWHLVDVPFPQMGLRDDIRRSLKQWVRVGNCLRGHMFQILLYEMHAVCS